MHHPAPAFLLMALMAADLWLVAARKPRHHAPPRETGQIACTVTGCHRIPPECHPEMGYDFWGNPTGFDIVVCPPHFPRR